jgi:phage-related protein
MASFTSAFGDLFKSFYELISAMIATVVNVFEGILHAIISFFTGILSLIGNTLSGVADVAGGLGKFVAGKLMPISTRSCSLVSCLSR